MKAVRFFNDAVVAQVSLGCCDDEPPTTQEPPVTSDPGQCFDLFGCISCICDIEDLITPDDVDRYDVLCIIHWSCSTVVSSTFARNSCVNPICESTNLAASRCHLGPYAFATQSQLNF